MEQVFQAPSSANVVEAKPVRVVLDRPLMTKPDGSAEARPSNRLLLVYMELSTKGRDASPRFRGWANHADDISLTDDRGVEYAVRTPRKFGGRYVDGHCHETVFLSSDKPVEYRPASQQDVPLAEQATKYAHYVFNESNGYRVLSDAIHDALVKKKGFVKVYWDEYVDSEIHTLSNMTGTNQSKCFSI